jgi:hypothetical protein
VDVLYGHQIKTECNLHELTTSGVGKKVLAATKHKAGFDPVLKSNFPDSGKFNADFSAIYFVGIHNY